MTRAELTEKILDIKREKDWSWKYICEKIGGYSEVLIVGACLGQMKLTKPQVAKAQELFGLSKAETALLNEVPMRGAGVPMPPCPAFSGSASFTSRNFSQMLVRPGVWRPYMAYQPSE